MLPQIPIHIIIIAPIKNHSFKKCIRIQVSKHIMEIKPKQNEISKESQRKIKLNDVNTPNPVAMIIPSNI